MNETLTGCASVPREMSLENFINEYNKGVFYFSSCDFLMERLNINAVYPYFKAIDAAEELDKDKKLTLGAILSRNMLSSPTKISVKGIQEVMKKLEDHWNIASNYGFVCMLEKEMDEKSDNPHFAKGELDNYITLFTFNVIFANSLRMTLILLDEIIKFIDVTPEDREKKYSKERLELRDKANQIGLNELSETWDRIIEASKTPSYQAFLDMHGFRRPLEASIKRLLNPIVGVLESNITIDKVVNSDPTHNKFFNLELKHAEDIIFTLENYCKLIIEDK